MTRVPDDFEFTLTFDDGPSEWTEPILDLLAEHWTKATFFMIGAATLEWPLAAARVVDDGHTVGVHSWSHRRLTDLPDWEVRLELGSTSRLLTLGAGVIPTCWRAPFYGRDGRVDAIARELGLGEHSGASVVPDDWCKTDAEEIARIVLDEIRPGSVVSLHDGIPPDGGSSSCTASRQPTVDAVGLILQGITA